jgi:hypothetical protein
MLVSPTPYGNDVKIVFLLIGILSKVRVPQAQANTRVIIHTVYH